MPKLAELVYVDLKEKLIRQMEELIRQKEGRGNELYVPLSRCLFCLSFSWLCVSTMFFEDLAAISAWGHLVKMARRHIWQKDIINKVLAIAQVKKKEKKRRETRIELNGSFSFVPLSLSFFFLPY